MKHLGDITQIRGDEIPVVDIITGGSPCQDLSVAGKRAGLAGERSGLFMEQIRIVKEMREHDRSTGRTAWLVRPRYMVWENVPGAFSSNKGADFQAVLTEIIRVVEPNAPDVPMPAGGRWSKAGCLYSDLGEWSIAWRVHDAQFWGVPQRRKRIALVADFGGLSAPEILFERKGLSRDSEQGAAQGQRTSGTTESRAGESNDAALSFQERAGKPGGAKDSLFSMNTQERCQLSATNPSSTMAFKQGAGGKAGGVGLQEEISPTLASAESGTNQVPAVAEFE